KQAEAADRAQSFWQSLKELGDDKLPKALDLYSGDDVLAAGAAPTGVDRTLLTLRQRYNDAVQSLIAENLRNLRDWPARLESITDETTEYQVRNKAIRVENYRESLSHQQIPKIAAP